MNCHRIGIIINLLIVIFGSRAQEEAEDAWPVASFGTKFIQKSDERLVIINLDKSPASLAPISNVTLSSSSLAWPNMATKINNNCLTDTFYGSVEMVNASRLMELLKLFASGNRSESKSNDEKPPPKTCLFVLFYASWCLFSSEAAPHFNVLPKFFPYIKAVAIDASKYQNVNTQFGIVGVPTLMFIYNGKPFATFNGTLYNLEMFAQFVTVLTGLRPVYRPYLMLGDVMGPVPTKPLNETDYCLVASYIFIAACAIYFTFQSHWWRQFVELVQNTWRESNAQHEHVD